MLSNVIIALVGAISVYFLVSSKKDEHNKKNSSLAVSFVSFIVIIAVLSWLFPTGVVGMFQGGGSGVDINMKEATRTMKMPLNQYEDGLIKSIREDVVVGQPPF